MAGECLSDRTMSCHPMQERPSPAIGVAERSLIVAVGWDSGVGGTPAVRLWAMCAPQRVAVAKGDLVTLASAPGLDAVGGWGRLGWLGIGGSPRLGAHLLAQDSELAE